MNGRRGKSHDAYGANGFYPCARTVSTAALLLQRLSRLAKLGTVPILDATRRRQVNYALYSTYCDCVRLGVRAEATAILGLQDRPREPERAVTDGRPDTLAGIAPSLLP